MLAKLKRDQGIDARPENMLITSGGSQAVSTRPRSLADPATPSSSRLRRGWVFFTPSTMFDGKDSQRCLWTTTGLTPSRLNRNSSDLKSEGITPKFIYIISNFQNPSGISTTLERRKRIVELAQEYGTLILEDDAYHDLRFTGERIPPIYTLDESGSTMYLGTLSKIMGAGMRIGWLVAAEDIITKSQF